MKILPRTCLIVPHYSEAVRAFLNIIKSLHQRGIQALVLVAETDTQTLTVCEEFDIPVIVMPVFSWYHQKRSPIHFFGEPWRVKRFCQRLFDSHHIIGLILVDDRRYAEIHLILAAKKRKIPTLVVMWAATNNSVNMMLWRQKSLAHLNKSSWRHLGFLVNRLAPQAIRQLDGTDIYWQHPLAIISLAIFATYPPFPWIFGGGSADKVAVIGDFYREMLIQEGIPSEKIVSTGHPRHDDLVLCINEWKQQPVITDKPYIVLAAPPVSQTKKTARQGHVTPEAMNQYLHRVIEDLLKLPFELVIKPHPRDVSIKLDYLDHHSAQYLVIKDYPIARLLLNASLLVCQGSSVVFDACGLDIPIVTFDFLETPGYDMWYQAGVSAHVTTPDNFATIVRAVLSDTQLREHFQQQRKKFVQHYMRLDGKATQRIIELIQPAKGHHPNATGN